jgi:hypothetical protein
MPEQPPESGKLAVVTEVPKPRAREVAGHERPQTVWG